MQLNPNCKQGTTIEAIEAFRLADRCMDRGDLDKAVGHYQKSIECDPDFMEAYYNLGLAYQGLAMNDLAVESYCRALELKPGCFNALNNLGQVLVRCGRYAAAENVYRRAMADHPQRPELHFNLGDLAMRRKNLSLAVTCYRKAIQLRPEMLEAYNNLGNALQGQKQLSAAARCYRQVIKIDPDLAEGYYNLGSVLREMDRFGEAIVNLEHALSLKPAYQQALNNLALCHKALGDLDRAAARFTAALQIDPDFAEARWNRSFTYLLNGDFANGWHDFEWRFKQPKWKSLYPFRLGGRRWDGGAQPGLRLLVHDEQGLGDTLQFVRYLPRVKKRVGTVIFETRRALMPLLEGFPGIDKMVERSEDGMPRAHYDAFVALMSLPYLFQTTPTTIPDGVPYLAASADKKFVWRERLAGPDFKIGIVWAGRPEHTNDRNRSCRLEQFTALADLPCIRWYGLQKGPAESQLGDWCAPAPFENLGAHLEDFTDTAGAIANLDLVITVDTSVAHLAGGMGAPVWLLLPFMPDWRWMMQREDSPWYPTMKLFRQPDRGDWTEVFRKVKASLRRMLQTGTSGIDTGVSSARACHLR